MKTVADEQGGEDASARVRRLLHSKDLQTEVLTRLASQLQKKQGNGWVGRALERTVDAAVRTVGKAMFPKTIGARTIVVSKKPASAMHLLDKTPIQLESVIHKLARPSVLVRNDELMSVELDYWKTRLDAARGSLQGALKNVGRVELKNHDTFDWNGTAWLVTPEIAVTNAHVARAFSVRKDEKWVFRTNVTGKAVGVRIDFREEYQNPAEDEFRVLEVLHLVESEEPDIAFLRVEPAGNRAGVSLAPAVNGGAEVAAVGYPKYDSSIPDPQVLLSIFNGIYDVKRVSPGLLMSAETSLLRHDCSTLGGSSGSMLIDLASGQACGLHFGGSYRVSNFAVPSPVIGNLLASLTP